MNPATPLPHAATMGPRAAHLPALDTPLNLALAQLRASRASLRAVMIPPSDTRADGPGDGADTGLLRSLWHRLQNMLPDGPMAELAAGVVRDWWQRHPWRPVAGLMVDQAGSTLRPLLRRRPLTVALGAAALGAGTVLLVRWRWGSDLRGPIRAAPRHLGLWMAAQLAQPALQTALLVKLAAWLKQATTDDSAHPPPETDPPAAPAGPDSAHAFDEAGPSVGPNPAPGAARAAPLP